MDGGNIPLTPTGAAAAGSTRTVRKRLSDGSSKSYQYTTIKKHIELTFTTDSEKLQFEQKCENIRLALGCKYLKDVLVKVIMNFDLGTPASTIPDPPLTIPSVMTHVDGLASETLYVNPHISVPSRISTCRRISWF